MIVAANLAFPRIGVQRELKQAIEHYWPGTTDVGKLEEIGCSLRRRHWPNQPKLPVAAAVQAASAFHPHSGG
jgi:5-methyltetrahydropteroyltriglutamate--homocysteine methyltransferase